jgi:hypothetical protein
MNKEKPNNPFANDDGTPMPGKEAEFHAWEKEHGQRSGKPFEKEREKPGGERNPEQDINA